MRRTADKAFARIKFSGTTSWPIVVSINFRLVQPNTICFFISETSNDMNVRELPGFGPAAEALLFRQKDPKPLTPRLKSLKRKNANLWRAAQLAPLKQGPLINKCVLPWPRRQASDHGRRSTVPSRSRRESTFIIYWNKEQLTLNQWPIGLTSVQPAILKLGNIEIPLILCKDRISLKERSQGSKLPKNFLLLKQNNSNTMISISSSRWVVSSVGRAADSSSYGSPIKCQHPVRGKVCFKPVSGIWVYIKTVKSAELIPISILIFVRHPNF